MKELEILAYVKCPNEGGHLVACIHCHECPYHWHVDYQHDTVRCTYGMTEDEKRIEGCY